MQGYTKLFGSIIASTIWRESTPTKVVWITMLAMANKHGIVEASIPGLADMSRVTLDETQKALEILSAPDSFSRTKDFEGRRIEAVDGGWVILNHAKYREKMSADERRQYNRLKQQEFRERQRRSMSTSSQQPSITVNHGQSSSAMSAHTEADTRDQIPDTTQSKKVSKKALESPLQGADGGASHAGENGAHPIDLVELIYDAYPRKTARQDALKAIRKVLSDFPVWKDMLLGKVQEYAMAVGKWPESDRHFIPHPATWFNRGSYEDDPKTWERKNENDGRSNSRSFENMPSYDGLTKK